ncbi:MAG: GIY-YIG nuclease family protein [Wolbachia sp.]
MQNYYVYILTNRYNEVLYIGITSDLIKQIWEHKSKIIFLFYIKV